MKEHDPATAASLEDLAACLRHVHLCADRPAYRTLEQQTAATGGFLPGTRLKRARLTRATVSDVLLGRKFPGKAFMLTLVDACGIDLETDRRWEDAWDRLAARYRQVSGAGEAEKLRQGNEELRRQLAEAHHRAAAREMSAEHELEELRRQLAAAKHQAETAEHRASQEQRRAEIAESQLETATRRAATAESLLERERKLSGSSFVSTMPHRDKGDAPAARGGAGARSGLASIPGLGAVTATAPGGSLAASYTRNNPPATPARVPDTASQQAFISEVAPGAVAAQRRYGIPASVTIAQAIDESSWGQSALAVRDHNLFGIKGTGSGGSDLQPTREFENGRWVTVNAPFRVYHNVAQSIADHCLLLATGPGYLYAMTNRHHPDTFAAALTGVYAADPQYGSNLIALMRLYNLYQYDATALPADGQ